MQKDALQKAIPRKMLYKDYLFQLVSLTGFTRRKENSFHWTKDSFLLVGLKSFPKNGFPLISVTVSTCRKKNQIREIGFQKTENPSAP